MNKTKRNAVAAIVVILIATFGASANAAEPAINNHEMVFKNFKSSLKRTEFPGIVESTIYTVVEYKNKYPELNYSDILNELEAVGRDNDNSSIRYKAHLASLYLSDSDGIEVTPVPGAFDHEYLFKQIADQFEKKFLASHIE